MIIRSAEFIKSAYTPAHYPPASGPEIAFAGRSNVGKSSLINALLNRKKLAKTSNTPGRTQSINFFRINDAFCFVDIPGYGYAKVPMAVRRRWAPMVETYLAKRQNLAAVVMIMDIRRMPGPEDQTLAEWLAHYHIPTLFVLTKADKLKRSKQISQKKQIADTLDIGPEDLILFSAKTRLGRNRLWEALTALLSRCA
jgi:GTP-binding protein